MLGAVSVTTVWPASTPSHTVLNAVTVTARVHRKRSVTQAAEPVCVK